MNSHESADRSPWHVTRCACGHLTLHLGITRLDLTADEFSKLHRLLDDAMRHFGVEPSDAIVVHGDATRH